MATEITALITICLTFQKVKMLGKWHPLTHAVAKEIEDTRKEPKVWVYFKNHSCRDCNLVSECITINGN